jgi:hypothetical protein
MHAMVALHRTAWGGVFRQRLAAAGKPPMLVIGAIPNAFRLPVDCLLQANQHPQRNPAFTHASCNVPRGGQFVQCAGMSFVLASWRRNRSKHGEGNCKRGGAAA